MNRYAAGVLMGALLCVLLVATAWASKPLTSSQVITLEHGPDGLWLSQAWVMEWQARPEWRLAAVYDVWRRSPDGARWAPPYRQMDLSLTWEPAMPAPLLMALTAGRRWRLDGDGGPWVYGMVALGW